MGSAAVTAHLLSWLLSYLLGSLLALLPQVTGLAVAVWLATLLLSGYVGLATVYAAISLPLLFWVTGGSGLPLLICTLAVALVVWMHRGNLQRVWAGTESCFERVRLLPRRRPSG